jgi:NAD(P)-dependent dehydrogenase (short-subunit alcohol dehydrogenase family)
MKGFADSVAVITGGASGIGLALAEAAVTRGAQVVIADIREDALAAAHTRLTLDGAEVLAVKTDVSRYEEVEALAEAAVRRFGKVNLMFNNAGVFASGVTWETSVEEYDWVIGVNLKSVINGIKAFVPRMIAQGDPCHVINTSSGAGITVNPGFASYSMTKHAVVALSEALYLDLAAQGAPNIGVTIVMPGVVQSKIMFPEKTGPAALQGELAARKANPTLNALERFMREAVDGGLPAGALADMVFRAIEDEALYVLPNFDDEASRQGAEAIALGRCNATNPYPDRLKAMLDSFSGTETQDA